MHLIHFSHFACPLQLVNRAVRYSFTFSENLTLPLGLLTAHPVRRDEWGEVSTGEVSGVLESNEQLEHSIPAVPIDENLRAQSLLIASYWPNLLTVCFPTSRCSSSCEKVSNTSTHPNTEHSNNCVVLSVSLLPFESLSVDRVSGKIIFDAKLTEWK